MSGFKQQTLHSRIAPWLTITLLFGGTIPLSIASYQAAGSISALAFVLALNLGYAACFSVFMYVMSWRELATMTSFSPPENTIPATVGVVIPAHNEAAGIIACVNSLLNQDIQLEQLTIINDGSSDDTLEKLIATYQLVRDTHPSRRLCAQPAFKTLYYSEQFPCLYIIDKSRGGKARALNLALEYVTSEILITVDADCVFLKDAIGNMTRRFECDDAIIAAGGVVKAANGLDLEQMTTFAAPLPAFMLTKLQWIEYATGFVWRFGWARLRSQLLLSGSFSGFRTRYLRLVGGFDPSIITEDYEICYRLHAYCHKNKINYKIITVPDALTFTLMPETYLSYLRQRSRWFQGFLQTLWCYKHLIFNPSYGWFGVFALPIKVIDALSPVLAGIAAIAIVSAFFDDTWPWWLIPALSLLAARWTLEFGYAVALLFLHHRFIQPQLGTAEKSKAYLLGPVNFIFHTLSWYIYGFIAHINFLRGAWSWEKSDHSGFKTQKLSK